MMGSYPVSTIRVSGWVKRSMSDNRRAVFSQKSESGTSHSHRASARWPWSPWMIKNRF